MKEYSSKRIFNSILDEYGHVYKINDSNEYCGSVGQDTDLLPILNQIKRWGYIKTANIEDNQPSIATVISPIPNLRVLCRKNCMNFISKVIYKLINK